MARSEKPSAGATWGREGNKWTGQHFLYDSQPRYLSGLVFATAVASHCSQVWLDPQAAGLLCVTERNNCSGDSFTSRKLCWPRFTAPDLHHRRPSPACTKETLILYQHKCIPDVETNTNTCYRNITRPDFYFFSGLKPQNAKLHSKARASLAFRFSVKQLATETSSAKNQAGFLSSVTFAA